MEVSGRANGVSFSETGDWEQDEKILQPFTYIVKASSKEKRAKLVQAFNYWLNVPEDKLSELHEVFQTVLVSGFLFDDIQDNCLLRRGVPAAHSVYGIASTISAAIFANFMSLQRALSTNQHEMIKLYTDMMLEAWRGQAIEIYWRENHTCPLEEEYLEMVKRSKDSVRAMSRI